MTQVQMQEHKQRLLEAKQKILNGELMKSREDLHVSQEDLADEADLANNLINQEISFSMRHRELTKLRAIDEALDRIENGTYGICEECDEPIEAKRLKYQPWTTLCITHAEEREREIGQSSRFA